MVGSPHIGADWGLPGGVGTQIQSGDPSRRTVVISQSTTVAESAIWVGAARSASAIFSSLVGSLLSAMMTALQPSSRLRQHVLCFSMIVASAESALAGDPGSLQRVRVRRTTDLPLSGHDRYVPVRARA